MQAVQLPLSSLRWVMTSRAEISASDEGWADIKAQKVTTKSKKQVVKSGRLKREAALDHRAKVCGAAEMFSDC